jgi:tRNA modification GTPase
VLHRLVELCLAHGARRARPGEFSERAFLNGRLDLAQAEAVADLIAAADLRAARAARRALDGEFSTRVEAIGERMLALRVHVEAMIDFSDEPLQTLGGDEVAAHLDELAGLLDQLLAAAERGRRLRDGLHAVIVGPPNAGKSSLLNALAGSERAIVTDIAGTTRDLLAETVRVAGVELTLVVTAGLREGGDAIEREGMRRARTELSRADLAIVVVDGRDPDTGRAAVADAIAGVPAVLWLCNKSDLLPEYDQDDADTLWISVRSGAGLDRVQARLQALAGVSGEQGGGEFTARARHVQSLTAAAAALQNARGHLQAEVLELAAEALREAHDELGEITGKMAPDDLLGHIFATFCIGK